MDIMPKIAILTMIGAQNHGAILQAIAMQKILLDNHFEPHFVNYQTYRQKSQYSVINIYNPSKKILIKNIQNIRHIKRVRKRIRKFNLFIEKEFLHKSTILRAKGEVIQYLKTFDVIIVGSDQVWNLNLNDASSVYFLDFPKQEKRIAYGVSLGGDYKDIFTYKDYILSNAQTFDFLSVRENIAFNFFRNNNILAQQVLDPTLLIEPSWWESKAIHSNITDVEYIVYYSVNCKPYSVNVCKTLSTCLHLPVYYLFLHPGIARTEFKPYYDINPFEFLGIIKNATIICTDSYHGLIFSLLFRKKFVIPVEGNDFKCEDRKATLIKMLNLTEHLCSENVSINQIKNIREVNDSIFDQINILKSQSIKYILESIGDLE